MTAATVTRHCPLCGHATDQPDEILRSGGLEMNLATRQVTAGGAPVNLTPLEYVLLQLLMAHPNMVLPVETLSERIWVKDYSGEVTIRVFVHRLRRKLGPRYAAHLHTVYHVGYCWSTT